MNPCVAGANGTVAVKASRSSATSSTPGLSSCAVTVTSTRPSRRQTAVSAPPELHVTPFPRTASTGGFASTATATALLGTSPALVLAATKNGPLNVAPGAGTYRPSYIT